MIDFSKYEDKTILIVGGGTSTLQAKWENLDYDYLWTCNQFYLEPRVYNQDIDFYLLSPIVDVTDKKLIDRLTKVQTTIVIETHNYRHKERTPEFKKFAKLIETPIFGVQLPSVDKRESSAGFAGAAFRLILTALQTKASKIMFSGFDGFNKDFTNIHAFTKHPGLKPTDTRRTFEGTRESYKTIFTDAYNWFLKQPGYERLQNLGEGFDYNIGTPISKKYFPLTKEVYDKIR